MRRTHNYYRLADTARGQGSEYNLIQEDKKFSKKTSLMFSQLGNQYEVPTFSNIDRKSSQCPKSEGMSLHRGVESFIRG